MVRAELHTLKGIKREYRDQLDVVYSLLSELAAEACKELTPESQTTLGDISQDVKQASIVYHVGSGQFEDLRQQTLPFDTRKAG
jgi:hypothetical protein